MTVEVRSRWVLLEEDSSSWSKAFEMHQQYVQNTTKLKDMSLVVCKGTPCYFVIFQGLGHRLRGSANSVRIRAPQIGGQAAKSIDLFYDNPSEA